MFFRTMFTNQKICLTCQHFKGVERHLLAFGSNLFIDYDKTMGKCGIFNDFPKLINEKAGLVSFCHYTRWRELPDE